MSWNDPELMPPLEADRVVRNLFMEKLLAVVVLVLLLGVILQFWIFKTSELFDLDTSRSLGSTLLISIFVAVTLVLLLVMRWKRLRKELERRIEVDRQLQLLKAAAETMEIGITISDVDGRILYVNRAEARMHGYEVPAELVGREARNFAPEELWNVQSLGRIKKSGLAKRESLNIRADGSVFPVQLISDVVCNRKGEPVGIVTSCEDISDRKARETELQESRRNLRELALHLEKIREAERLEIAHEIHNDLGAALTVLKLDLALLAARYAENQELEIEKLHAMEENIDDMIDRIRRLSRQLRPFLLDDAGLVAAIEWYCRDFSDRTGIPIDFEAEEISGPIAADSRELLFRTFQEGVTNALRHASPRRISVVLREQGDRIALSVSDDGEGCPGDPTRSSKAFGLLALRERAESQGGAFEFRSEPGAGATLKVTVLRKEAAGDDLGTDR